MGWTVRGSNTGAGEIFLTRPDRPCVPPSLLYYRYRVFPGGKLAGVWRWPPAPSIAEVKERIELYPCSNFRPSWLVIGWPLPLPLQRAMWRFRLRLRIGGFATRQSGMWTEILVCAVLYNEINYIHQHYLFMRKTTGLHSGLSHWCCVHIGIPICLY